ncbi:FadR/GntR family transcriptional regulator [Myceligenerans salitolerans]|uniref:FadR family transcriptional regulator n=1 Tax=Myceligenerans salitolerans TaxID=1230528 RepID=A0ABS3I8R5_9MICO|nr:GntR family transcriptional regulator [Myceligenerans salitolerans]MBO0609335.1 FadR family transcriptional regulator [Myceligenerans salitolerans]
MRTHERVLARIEAELVAGRWALGERLPGERALADELGVSRTSVREAIRILEAAGVVRTAVGSGPTAGAVVVDRPAAGLHMAMRLHVSSGALRVPDVVATRVLLETWAIRTAGDRYRAREIGDTALAGARRLVDAMEEPGMSSTDFIAADQAFHLEFARIAGNHVVEAFLLGLRGAIGQYVTEGVSRLPDWPNTSARLAAEHAGILEAVSVGDGATAARLAREHIEEFYVETGLAGELRPDGGLRR